MFDWNFYYLFGKMEIFQDALTETDLVQHNFIFQNFNSFPKQGGSCLDSSFSSVV